MLFIPFVLKAQQAYWTNYTVVVAPEKVATVYNLINDYYTANPPEGVTVSFWENHFSDHDNNSTHALIFSGSLDAMGKMYSQDGGAARKLFLAQLNQRVEEGYSSNMGTRLSHNGDLAQDYPVQKYIIVHADNGAAFDEAFSKLHKANTPEGTLNMMGIITSGASPEGENRWVINGFKDFKSAIGGANAMRNPAEKTARTKSWKEFQDTKGESHLVWSGTRIRMGQWK